MTSLGPQVLKATMNEISDAEVAESIDGYMDVSKNRGFYPPNHPF